MELFLCYQKNTQAIRDSPSPRAMHSNLGLKNRRKRSKKRVRNNEQGNQKKEVGTKNWIIGLSFMLMSPTAPYSAMKHLFYGLAYFSTERPKWNLPPTRRNLCFKPSTSIISGNINPLGRSKMQQPETHAQKKKVPFNLLCKAMTN